MADSSIVNAVRKYKSILDSENNEEILLRILRKLERVKMSLEILKETSIGKTVNKLNKRNGEVKTLSSRIVSQWKKLVNEKNDNVVNYKTEMPAKDLRSKNTGGHSNRDYGLMENSRQSSNSSLGAKRKGIGDDEEEPKSGKRQKCEPSTTSNRESRSVSSDDDEAPSMSFEACLGMSDVNHPTKKKSSKTKNSSSGSSSSGSSQSHNHSKHNDKKTEEPNNVRSKNSTGDRVKRETVSSSSNVPRLLEKPLDVPLPVLTLPEIQPNYRPIRNHFIIDDTNTNLRKRQIEKDDTYFMSSRHNRTQVFSGRKSNMISEVPSLREAALRVLQDNPRTILGEYRDEYMWFDILEPVITRLSPEQLYQLEQNHDKLTADTHDLWKAHCHRTFKNSAPKKEESWQELYWRLVRERENRLKSITANISQSMAKSVPVRQTKLAYVDCTAKPPRAVARQQARFGTGSGSSRPEVAKPVSNKVKLLNSITANVAKTTSEVVPAPSASSSSSHAGSSSSSTPSQQKVVKKVAPLMQKTLKFIKNRFRR